MASRSGSRVRSSQLPECKYLILSSPGMSGIAVRVAVLITTCFAVTCSSPTCNAKPGPRNRAWPRSSLGFAEFSKLRSRPVLDSSAISLARRMTAAKSTSTCDIRKPKSPALRARCATLAEAIAALVGVHPKLTHDPPKYLRSASATVFPALASARASGGPACPPPIIKTSKLSVSVIGCLLRSTQARMPVLRGRGKLGAHRIHGRADYRNLVSAWNNFDNVVLQRTHLHHFVQILIQQVYVQVFAVESGHEKLSTSVHMNRIRGGGGQRDVPQL